MIHRMREHFLERAEDYDASVQNWTTLVERIADSLGQRGEWPPWIPRTSPNGAPLERDGNPIYDGRSAPLDRAFRIIQQAPVSEDIEMSAWLSHCEPEYPDLPGDELVLNLSLSEESSKLAEVLLHKWMLPETTSEAMSAFIEAILPSKAR
jgi:hypothetical protein